jgi:hypothetical protein
MLQFSHINVFRNNVIKLNIKKTGVFIFRTFNAIPVYVNIIPRPANNAKKPVPFKLTYLPFFIYTEYGKITVTQGHICERHI